MELFEFELRRGDTPMSPDALADGHRPADLVVPAMVWSALILSGQYHDLASFF